MTGMDLLNVALESATMIGLFYVGGKANKIDSLEARLERKQNERIDEKFEEIKEKLQEGDGALESLNKSDQKLELKIAGLVTDFKEFCRTTFASREDLKEHERKVDGKFDHLEQQTGKLHTGMAVIQERLGKRNAG